MSHIWAVREADGSWSHYLDTVHGITHVVHGTDGKGDLNVEDYKVERLNRAGFNKLVLTWCYTRRLGWKDAGGGKLMHDGKYVYDR